MSHDLARSRDQRVLVVSYHPVNFGGHKHCGSVDLIFLVVEWQNSTYPHFHPQLLHSLKDMFWKHTAYYINNSDSGHTRLKQQFKKNLKICQFVQNRWRGRKWEEIERQLQRVFQSVFRGYKMGALAINGLIKWKLNDICDKVFKNWHWNLWKTAFITSDFFKAFLYKPHQAHSWIPFSI